MEAHTLPVTELHAALLAMNRVGARSIVVGAVRDFGSPYVMEQLLTPVLEDIGVLWEKGTVALAQVYMSGCICEEILDEILPPADTESGSNPAVAIAVLEDSHALGKRLVLSAMKANGMNIHDYGSGITVDELAERVRADGIQILLVSALMLRSALRVVQLRAKLGTLGCCPVIIVGGAPFRLDPQLWREVGADGVAMNSSETIGIVRRLLKTEVTETKAVTS